MATEKSRHVQKLRNNGKYAFIEGQNKNMEDLSFILHTFYV